MEMRTFKESFGSRITRGSVVPPVRLKGTVGAEEPPPADEEVEGKRYQLVGVGGEHGQIENVEGEFDTVDEVILGLLKIPGMHIAPEELDWIEDIKDPSNWSTEGYEDGLLRFAIDEIYEVVDTQSAEDQEESDWTIKMAQSRRDVEELLRASQHPPHKGGLEGSDLERFEVWRKKISRLLDELSYGEEY